MLDREGRAGSNADQRHAGAENMPLSRNQEARVAQPFREHEVPGSNNGGADIVEQSWREGAQGRPKLLKNGGVAHGARASAGDGNTRIAAPATGWEHLGQTQKS